MRRQSDPKLGPSQGLLDQLTWQYWSSRGSIGLYADTSHERDRPSLHGERGDGQSSACLLYQLTTR
jgi:hypothetical protein